MPLKSLLVFALKLSVSFGLIYWMWASGKLRLDETLSFLMNPYNLLMTVVFWAVVQALACGRWLLLLRGVGYQMNFFRAFQLHMTGLFFNTAMPGAVGGDLVKATYVYLDFKQEGKSPAMASIMMDRVLGLFGLFTLGGLMLLLNLNLLSQNPGIRHLGGVILGLMGGATIFLWLVGRKYRSKDPIVGVLEKNALIGHKLLKIYETFRRYQDHQKYVWLCWGLSIVIQGITLLYFILIATFINGPIDPTLIAVVFPVGILATALPLAPGGLGVGHVAFDKLFLMVGLANGATIFNVYVLNYLALNLTGAISYVLLKRKQPLPTAEDELQTQTSVQLNLK